MNIDILHVAKFARLKIEPEKVSKFESEMQSILSMVENLPKIVDDGIGLDVSNPMRLRGDEIKPSFSRDSILQNAPKKEAGCVVVPKVVE